MNVLITTAKDGVLTVHRDTCKKIEERETQGVDDVLESNPGSLTTNLKKASCCKPTDTMLEDVEQAGWDALEQIANEEAEAAEEAGDGEFEADEDLIGDVQQNDEGITAEDEEDLIGGTPTEASQSQAAAVSKAKGKTAAKVSAAKSEAREVNGAEALQKVGKHLGLSLGKAPAFPGFGKAFKTADKQSVYVNSKGNADVRAKDAEQAAEWAALDHVERRSGNYVRVNLAAL